MATAQPSSLLVETRSLIETCTEISQLLASLKSKLRFVRITFALLHVECEIISCWLVRLEQALKEKPDLLSWLKEEDGEVLEMGWLGIAFVVDELNEELGLLRDRLEVGTLVEEEREQEWVDGQLNEFVRSLRDQGLSVSFLVACVEVNCDPGTIVYGISSVANSVLRENYTKAKSLHSKSESEYGVQKGTETRVPAMSLESKLTVNKPLPPDPNPGSKAKHESIDKGTSEEETLINDFRSSGASTVPTIDAKGSNKPKTIINTSPEPKQLSKRLLEVHNAIEAGIRSGNVVGVKALLKEAVDTSCIPLSELESGDCSFLGEAIEAGSVQMVQLLLEYGVYIEGIAVHSVGYGALHWATSRNQIDIVKILLQEGIDVMKRTPSHGETALFIACRKGLLEMVKLLLRNKKGSVLDTVGRENKTPLQTATLQNFSEIVEVLLEAGANVCLLDDNGYTPLHVAAENGHVAIARSLIKHQAEIDAKDPKNKTPLHLATSGGHVAIIELLMEYGTELDARDSGKKTPLHLAARNGHKDAAELMIEYGAELEAQDDDGWTPLHFATYNKRHDIINILLESGALVDSKSNTGKTCLMRAAELDDPISITALCEHGADINMINNSSGFSAIHFAAHEGSINAMKTLISLGSNLEKETTNGSTPLIIASWRGRLEIIKILLAANVAVNHQRSHKITALRDAASEGHDAVCALLLSHGANVDSRDADNETPLMVAASNNRVSVLKTLLKAGASIDAKENNSHSALYGAAHNGHVDVVEALLDAGASVNIETNMSGTALHIAAFKGHSDVVKLLLERGADRSVVARHNNVKGTPAEVASLAGFKGIGELIEGFKSSPLIRTFVADDKGGVWSKENTPES